MLVADQPIGLATKDVGFGAAIGGDDLDATPQQAAACVDLLHGERFRVQH